MTTRYRYKKIDAFTAGESSGNPAACLYLAPGQHLDDEQMLAVARAPGLRLGGRVLHAGRARHRPDVLLVRV